MEALLDFTGKVMVVTGGTRGIGKSIAEAYCQCGASVAVIGKNPQRGIEAQQSIGHSGGSCRFYQCDISDSDAVKDTSEAILSDYGRVDVLTVNAGIEVPPSSIADTKISDWKQLMAVNLDGAFYFIKYLIPAMEAQSSGHVIFISSVSSRSGGGTGIHYPASKAALQGMMARINYDLLPKGIRANMISPGLVDTPLLRRKYPDTPDINASLNAQVPMGRIARPVDIARIALFLASPMSEYICGQEIIADGGRSQYRRSVVSTG
mgnify:CR=1 FL=1